MNDNDRIIFTLMKTVKDISPDNFHGVKLKIAEQIADELMVSLEGVPSFEGRLIGEGREKLLSRVKRIGA